MEIFLLLFVSCSKSLMVFISSFSFFFLFSRSFWLCFCAQAKGRQNKNRRTNKTRLGAQSLFFKLNALIIGRNVKWKFLGFVNANTGIFYFGLNVFFGSNVI